MCDWRVIVVRNVLVVTAYSLSLSVLQGLMSHNVTENLLLGMLKWN